MSLDGKVALITGAGRGIGRAIALALAGAGASIVATGRNTSLLEQVVREIRAAGGTAHPVSLDVTRPDDAERAARQAVDQFGRLDILVNNAGVIIYDTPVWATSIEQWDTVINTNLRGLFLVSRAVIPYMMEQKDGTIINIGSSSGRQPEGDYGAYVTSKYGVVGYTASLAHSLQPYGIRVNGINPGWVDTDMAREHIPQGDPQWITGDEIARAALYLAADAPCVMTGQFIDIFSA